jgi:hypothetical protein
MKICSKCGENKPRSDYGRKAATKDGLISYCKACDEIYKREYRKTMDGKNAIARGNKKYKLTSNGKKSTINGRLKYKYGITLDEYDAMLQSQGMICAICGTDTPGGWGRFLVDHDHGTGKLRGLLCNGCNGGLGFFKDSSAVLIKAIGYLNDRAMGE